MMIKTFALLVCAIASLSCGRQGAPSKVESQNQVAESNTANRSAAEAFKVGWDAAAKTARDDYIRVFGPEAMRGMEATVTQEANGWRVSIHAKPSIMYGGGAVYSIDKETGKILDRKIYQ